ncbi:hypothetical protein [Demequina zhanjiangensis]|uniref:DUF4190 domain-containing protein n=1 Tax=Demequina zhanjiangensis TaxID=3051659 RepID=A0ABT8G274_9MICO|nr:hypothetical protein [Demequina sp. SYSU T00b26]MDN4473228.1 hypothetical protein [Demequina sp. SYSU T00b26]
MSAPWPGDEGARDRIGPQDDGGLIVPPDDWTPKQAQEPGAGTQIPGSPVEESALPGTAPGTPPNPVREPVPNLEGLAFTRATEHNSRAVIGMALSGIAAALILAFIAGFNSPLLITVALGIGGIVMGWRGYLAARNGLASNGTLGIAAVVVGALAILSVVGIYAMVLFALSQIIP